MLWKTPCFVAFGIVVALPSLAQNTPLVTCGDLDGYAYYAGGEGRLGPPGGGWVKDSISPGRTVIVATTQGGFDVLSQHAAGYSSYSAEGCVVTPAIGAPGKDAFYVMVAVCASSIESFQFLMNPNGTGKLLYSQAKFTNLLVKSTVMTANCRRE